MKRRVLGAQWAMWGCGSSGHFECNRLSISYEEATLVAGREYGP